MHTKDQYSVTCLVVHAAMALKLYDGVMVAQKENVEDKPE